LLATGRLRRPYRIAVDTYRITVDTYRTTVDTYRTTVDTYLITVDAFPLERRPSLSVTVLRGGRSTGVGVGTVLGRE